MLAEVFQGDAGIVLRLRHDRSLPPTDSVEPEVAQPLRFIALFTRARHWALSRGHMNPVLSCHLYLGFPTSLFPSFFLGIAFERPTSSHLAQDSRHLSERVAFADRVSHPCENKVRVARVSPQILHSTLEQWSEYRRSLAQGRVLVGN